MTTYKFTQNVGYDADGKLVEPVKYASLYDDDADSQVTARAALWGLPGDPDESITMTRYYAAQRTFWVDPVSGTIVKKKEHGYHYYAREALKPEVTFVDYKVTSNEETVESQVASARDERDRVALWGRILPITFTAMGLVALVGGALLGSFSLRAESALIDPGLDEADHRFFDTRRDRAPGAGRRGQDREAADVAADRSASGQTGLTALFAAPRQFAGAGVRAGAVAGGDGAAAGAGISAAARRGVDAALVPVRCGARAVGGRAAGAAAGLRGGAGLARDRRRRGGQGAVGRPGCGWPGGARRGWRRRCCPTPGWPASAWRPRSRSGIRMSPNGFCRATGACWWATAACRGWRRRCCGCANRRRRRLGRGVRAGVLDRAGRADADGADAGGDGGGGVRSCAGCGPAAVVLRSGWLSAPRCWRRCRG